MNKLDLIKESQEKLAAENLEKEKAQVLEQLRLVETRIKNAAAHIRNSEEQLERAKKHKEKQVLAGINYKETGDWEEYEKAVGIDAESQKKQQEAMEQFIDKQKKWFESAVPISTEEALKSGLNSQ